MPHRVPTLSELRTQVRDDFRARLPGADSLLPASNLRVIGDVYAELTFGLYAWQVSVVRDLMPDTAEGEWLDRRAELRSIQRKPASFATGAVSITGSVGAEVAEGAELRTASGVLVRVTQGKVLGAGVNIVQAEAAASGAAGNLDAGVQLSFTSAIPGVDAAASVAAGGLAGGADAESNASLRARLLARLRRPPQGGAVSDYEAWALEVPGVTRVWVERGAMGPGTVTVRFMMDEVRAAEQGIPQGETASEYSAGSGDLQTVFDHIAEVRPVTADVFVVAPVAVPLDIEFAALSPDTPAVRAAIAAEIDDMLYRDAEPGEPIRYSRLVEAISIAAGEGHHALVSPLADVPHGPGEIAVSGNIVWPA